MKRRAHVLIYGIVQGVFFRSRTKNMAEKIGVAGWIRNLQDGRVEAIFEGNKEAVEDLINFCKKGPPNAEVMKVEVQWEDYTGEYVNFIIR
jgi:acylphosphatase